MSKSRRTRKARQRAKAASTTPSAPTAALVMDAAIHPQASFLPTPRAGYDATVDKKKRTTPRAIIKSEDTTLNAKGRKTLTATATDQMRNISLLAWMVRKHTNYVSRFQFQARTPDEEFNRALEARMRLWGQRRNCDIAARHRLERLMYIWEISRTTAGDVGIMRVKSGHVQSIEGDRIANPTQGDIPDGLAAKKPLHGVITNPAGRAKQYIINSRKGSGLIYEKTVQAHNLFLHNYSTRIDQWRGVSPLSSAMNTVQDLYETIDFSVLKAKAHAFFGMIIKSDKPEVNGGFRYTETDTGEVDAAGDAINKYDVKMADGPFKMELDPGDSAEAFESKSPSLELQSFTTILVRIILLSLDIPYTFYDAKGANFSARIGDNIQYAQSAHHKREDNRELLDWITQWLVWRWVNIEGMALPRGMRLEEVTWEWQGTGVPLTDPTKELGAAIKAIAAGIKSPQMVCKELGYDYFDVIDQIKVAYEYAKASGVPLAMFGLDKLNATGGAA